MPPQIKQKIAPEFGGLYMQDYIAYSWLYSCTKLCMDLIAGKDTVQVYRQVNRFLAVLTINEDLPTNRSPTTTILISSESMSS